MGAVPLLIRQDRLATAMQAAVAAANLPSPAVLRATATEPVAAEATPIQAAPYAMQTRPVRAIIIRIRAALIVPAVIARRVPRAKTARFVRQ